MKRFKMFRLLAMVMFVCLISFASFEGLTLGNEGSAVAPSVETPAAAENQKALSLAEARRILQESSRVIAELLHKRPSTNSPTPSEKERQEKIDGEIAVIQSGRTQAFRKVVLAANPKVRILDEKRDLYIASVTDDEGKEHRFSGSIPAIWHLSNLSSSVFTLAPVIRSRPDEADLPKSVKVSSHLLLSGTSSQSMVHPYPGDIDYAEEFSIEAPTKETAGEAMAALLVESVKRTSTDPMLEFDKLVIMPTDANEISGTDTTWPLKRILDPSQREELVRQLLSLDGGRINSHWRKVVAGDRYIVIGKVLSFDAWNSADGKKLIATLPLGTKYQEVFFGKEVPQTHQKLLLGEYASLMRYLAQKEARKENYLKAAKRAFNYFRAIGDLEAMTAVIPIFATPEAKVYQQSKALEAVAMALDLATPSRILTAKGARDQLFRVATVIKTDLPVLTGTLPERPEGVAKELHAIADKVRSQSNGLIEPDGMLAHRLETLRNVEIKPIINLSLKGRVEKIMNTYVQ